MAPRGDRFNRRQRQGSWLAKSDSSTAVIGSLADEVVNTDAPSQSISILQEVFPGSAGNDASSTSADKLEQAPPPLDQLLAGIPTPSRAASSMACNYAPAVSSQLAPLTLPPQVCQQPQDMLDLSVITCAPAAEPHLSYRERLRAGGRGAFQRAFEAGLMPTTMKQDWNDAHAAFQFQSSSRSCTPMSTPMSYKSPVGSQPMWNLGESPHGSEYWPIQLEQPNQLPSIHQQSLMHSQEVHQANGLVQQQTMVMPNGGAQQLQMQQPMQMLRQGQMGMDTSSMMAMMQGQQMQMQMPLPGGGNATPTEFHRCMAIVMPENAMFAQDKNMVAAQLQAAADCQRYED